MGRERGAAESYDSAEPDLIHDQLVVIREIGNKSVGSIDSLCPLVTLDLNLDAGLPVAGKVLARGNGLDSSGNG